MVAPLNAGWLGARGRLPPLWPHADGYNRREFLRILAWGIAYPGLVAGLTVAAAVMPAASTPGWLYGALLALLLLAPVMIVRIGLRRRLQHANAWADSLLFGAMTFLGKVPEAHGALNYLKTHWTGGRARLIEYK